MQGQTIQSTEYYIKDDDTFNTLYRPDMRALSVRHWTPLHVTKQAVNFFDTKQECRILDIGSGVGKFCLAGGLYAPNLYFFGVEQRPQLIEHALKAKKLLGLKNVSFIAGNFTQIDFRSYHHFYFYNAFHENIDDSDRIDDKISYSYPLYDFYARHLHNNLRGMPTGTKIVTYHTLWNEIPREYRLVDSLEKGTLNFWVKR